MHHVVAATVSFMATLAVGIANPQQAKASHARAAQPIATSAHGHPQAMFWPGEQIGVATGPLPAGALCVGLASRTDRSGLPLNLGHMRQARGHGVATVTIPPHLLQAEPEGPWLLFVGRCAGFTVDTPIVAQATIGIEPLPQS